MIKNQVEYSHNWYIKNRERILARNKERYYKKHEQINKRAKNYYHNKGGNIKRKKYAEINKEKLLKNKRYHHVKSAFGLSRSEYDMMIASQGGVCWICKEKSNKRNLCIDHNHETNKIRGLLCTRCNFLIGACKENISLLLRSIDYLNYFEPTNKD